MKPEKVEEFRRDILRAMQRSGEPLRSREIAAHLQTIGWYNASSFLVASHLQELRKSGKVQYRKIHWGKQMKVGPRIVLEHTHGFWMATEKSRKEFWRLSQYLRVFGRGIPTVPPVVPRIGDMRTMVDDIQFATQST